MHGTASTGGEREEGRFSEYPCFYDACQEDASRAMLGCGHFRPGPPAHGVGGAHHRAHRSRNLHRLGHPGLPRPEGRLDQQPASREDATLRHYLADPDIRRQAWRNRLESPAWSAAAQRRPPGPGRPSSGRDGCGRLSPRTSTSCTSGPGSDPELVVELHGTMREVRLLVVRRSAPWSGRSTGSCR